jgi:hypothetical protein
MSRRKNRQRFELNLLADEARAVRRLAKLADVSVTQLLTRAAEVLAKRGRAGCIGLDGCLAEKPGVVTITNNWQQLIEDREAPAGAFLEIDLRQNASRFGVTAKLRAALEPYERAK